MVYAERRGINRMPVAGLKEVVKMVIPEPEFEYDMILDGFIEAEYILSRITGGQGNEQDTDRGSKA